MSSDREGSSSRVDEVAGMTEAEEAPITAADDEGVSSERKGTISSYRQNQVTTVVLADVPIVALHIDGKERLCLAQISNTLLKGYSYNEIHNRRVALGITCVQCTPVQLEILRRAGAMPVSSRRCGMITKREAERLVKSFLEDTSPPKLPEDFAFDVIHECGWGCRGSFVPSRYNSSRAKCIKCAYCNMYFSPNKFIFHYHRTPDAKYNHPDAANFNSWRRHLRLTCEQDNVELVYAWEDVKAMFNGGSRKRMSTGSSRQESIPNKPSQDEAKKPRFHDNVVETKSHLTPPMDYNPYPMFPTPSTGTAYPILPATFPPVSLALPVTAPHQDRSPYVGTHRASLPSVQLSSDFNGSSRTRPVGNLFCSPFDKIWPKYPSLFFSGGHDMNFGRCERFLPPDHGELRMIGYKSPKSSPSGAKKDSNDLAMDSGRVIPRDSVTSLSGLVEDRQWCSAFRLVGNPSKKTSIDSSRPDNVKSRKTVETIYGRDSPVTESQTDKVSEHGDEGFCADEESEEEISVKEPDVDIEDDCPNDHTIPQEPPESNAVSTDLHSSEKSEPDTNVERAPEIKPSHRKETADSTSGSTDFSTLSREQLQTELQQEMEARKKIEKECTTIKETFEDQIKRAVQYREDIAKQLQAVRETLCTKLDQERKVRMSLQERLKEAHDALHSFTCNMLSSRHCTECSVKEILPR